MSHLSPGQGAQRQRGPGGRRGGLLGPSGRNSCSPGLTWLLRLLNVQPARSRGRQQCPALIIPRSARPAIWWQLITLNLFHWEEEAIYFASVELPLLPAGPHGMLDPQTRNLRGGNTRYPPRSRWPKGQCQGLLSVAEVRAHGRCAA